MTKRSVGGPIVRNRAEFFLEKAHLGGNVITYTKEEVYLKMADELFKLANAIEKAERNLTED
jgi:hypothetical protein